MRTIITLAIIYVMFMLPIAAQAQQQDSKNFRLSADQERGQTGKGRSEKPEVRIEGKFTVAGAVNPRDAASKFLETNSRQLKIDEIYRSKGAAELKVVDESASLTGNHITYQQYFENLPVFNQHVKVSVNKKLQVTQVTSDVSPVGSGRGLNTKLTGADRAAKTALAAVQAERGPNTAPKMEPGIIMDSDENPTTVFKVTFSTRQPAGAWEVFVDARSNKVLSVRNKAFYFLGRGRVFNPNPIASTNGKIDFQDADNADSVALNAQRVPVVLHDLDDSGTLSGTYATTAATWSFVRASNKLRAFDFTRSDPRFEEVMSYHYVTEAARSVNLMGFNVKQIFKSRPLPISVNGTEEQNAFFDPVEDQLVFGTGGVDAAEDGTVIVHEFGHGLLNHQAPTFEPGMLTEGGAIHEGFGDYLSASFFYQPSRGDWNKYLGSWFAAGIPRLNGHHPLYLRAMDSTKRYPVDLDQINEPHANGEIWSATLWDIFNRLGKRNADRLILESNFRLSGKQGFADAAKNILQVDRELNAGANQKTLTDIFTARGIVGSPDITLRSTTWNGRDVTMRDPRTDVIQYKYEFRENGSVRASVNLLGGTPCVDENARYIVTSNRISVSIGDGMIQQDGSINGDRLAGQTLILFGGANNAFSKCFEKAAGRGDTFFFLWRASRF